ncbi:MAG TPA: cytochrome c [Balneolaceae bacterium]|nr:cytochrome c [Balneolaceae bacterium]
MAEKDLNQIRIFLDDQEEPIVTYRPPVRFELDTTGLADGKHILRIEASDAIGKIGTRTVPFEVRNGPGIGIEGIQENDVLEGRVPVLINAYGGASEPNWEPSRAETPAPVPTWAWVLLLAIIGWSMVYIAQQWNPPAEFAASPTYSFYSPQPTAAEPVEKPSAKVTANAGATLYRTSCATCHQANGMGIPGAFPPLAGDPVVTDDDPTHHIKIVLFGLQNKAINGVEYSAVMPAFSEQLSDEEVAAIINHERTSWGNDAPTITAKDVQKVRAKEK